MNNLEKIASLRKMREDLVAEVFARVNNLEDRVVELEHYRQRIEATDLGATLPQLKRFPPAPPLERASPFRADIGHTSESPT
jgi:hypothetical protein